MLTGIDTSYFYALAAGCPQAVEAWENRELLTSALCFFELKKRLLQGDFKAWPSLLEDIAKAVEVLPVSADASVQAGRIAREAGLPAFDAILVSQFIEAGCGEILTMDHHFKLFAKKGLTITLLSNTSEK